MRGTSAAAVAFLLLSGCLTGSSSEATDAGPTGGSQADGGGGAPGGAEAGSGGGPQGGSNGGTGGTAGGTDGGGPGGAATDAEVPPPDAPVGPPGDRDDDGVPDADDNCPDAANHNQADADADGAGDDCDNCPADPNADQADADADGTGDACDANDDDADGIPGATDNCPSVANPGQQDRDNDGVGDACDNCPQVPNFSQMDDDGDGIGNACEIEGDDDGDGIPDASDNCPQLPSADVRDTDNDGVGDVCDNCPQVPNFSQRDEDGDGLGDACDNGDPPDAGPASDCVGAGTRCHPDDGSLSQRCQGGEWVDQACAPGEVCDVDACVPATCLNVARLESELGCDFKIQETPNLILAPPEGNALIPFGILVANPGPDPVVVHVRDADERDMALIARVNIPASPSDPFGAASEVTSAVFDAQGAAVQTGLGSAHATPIPAGGYGRFALPHPNQPQDWALSRIRRASWHVTSDRPVVVTQHNPICCQNYYSGGASLVPPTALAGRRFRFVGHPTWVSGNGNIPPTMTVMPVGVASNVEVSEAAHADLPSGDDGGPIVEAANRRSAALQPGDAASFEGPIVFNDAANLPDLSGLAITGSTPVAVISSHVCTRLPHPLYACDHTEEFLPPTDRWGRRFSLSPAPLRAEGIRDERTYWRFVADRPGTEVTLSTDFADLDEGNPSADGTVLCSSLQTAPNAFSLAAGQSCELSTREPLGVTGSEPLLILGAAAGQQATGSGGGVPGDGDPATFVATADEQETRQGYATVSDGWDSAVFQVVVPAGARLRHRGQVVNLAAARGIPGTDRVTVEIDVTNLQGRVHKLEADEPFHATLFLYGSGVASAHPVNQALRAGP